MKDKKSSDLREPTVAEPVEDKPVFVDEGLLENLLSEVETTNLPSTIPAENSIDVMTNNFGFSCNNCIINDSCKAFKADSTCSIPLFESEINPDKDTDYLLVAQKFRVKRGLMIESVQGGGVLDTQLTSEMRFMLDLIERREGRGKTTSSITVTATGDAAKNVTKPGGLLSSLLTGNPAPEKEVPKTTEIEKEIIDVPNIDSTEKPK